ncbi:hypothetical protein [Streptomyces sp. bgisy034]|uniref:hypothetical protein n=1 Tax=Streptomyces sp. bgisy034 TaxID=3413774 RepID=UPI003EB944EB
MSAPVQASGEEPQAPALVISDSSETDPVGLHSCPVPHLHLPSPLFSSEEYQRAPLVLLDDRSYLTFTQRHLPHRPGLIVVLADPDDATVYPRAAAIGADAVIRAGENLAWLHLRLHDATGCRYVNWQELPASGEPPPPGS